MKQLIITITVLALLTLILPGPALAQAPVVCEDEYTVQAGDWLSKIAEKYYGDVMAYPAIVIAANTDSGDTYTDIVDPNLIEPGWTLCIPSGEDMARLMAMSIGTAPPGLSEAELANATYKSEWTQDGTAPLTDGEYSEAAAPGSATKTEVILTSFMAYGRLNDQDVAAVVLVTLPGGSGSFYDLHVVASQNGQPVDVASAFLGDRVEINAIVIENGQIKVDMVQAGPDDPMCCPGQHVIKTYDLQGDQLVEVSSEIVGAEGKPELIGTLWRWDQTAMNNGDKLVPANPNSYTVEFFPDGRVSAQADCNRANGTYTVDGSSISVEILQMTMAACPPGSLGDNFVKNLNEAVIYFIEGKNLFVDLKFDSGTMKFSAVGPISLAGTSWLVRGYNNGKQGVVSAIIGTELTAIFDENGQLTGLAGCNTYSASYEIDGENIAIGPTITTLMECAEPEGIMEQEMQYLAALQTAATHKFEGERLQLRTAEGSLAADFVSAVSGQVTYLQRVALPEDAFLQVQLLDVSLADAPATVIGEWVLLTTGRQVPLPFEVTYNPADIDPRHTYAIQARITDAQGNLLFINTTQYRVITQDNPIFGVEVMVEPVG